jgi:hypothetical protein
LIWKKDKYWLCFFFLKDLDSIAKHTEWISTDNRFLLREEVIYLKDKLYNVYDDLSILFNQNEILQINIQEQKQELVFYKQQLKYFI